MHFVRSCDFKVAKIVKTYSGVPQNVVVVIPFCMPSLQSPKSVNIKYPFSSNSRFSGFKSLKYEFINIRILKIPINNVVFMEIAYRASNIRRVKSSSIFREMFFFLEMGK